MVIMLLNNATLTCLNDDTSYGLVEHGALVIEDEQIRWLGPMEELPSSFSAVQTVNLGGRVITPALIDCHTHIVHGGDRADEFELRLQGATYEEVARSGGGIISTVNATRAASLDELIASALPRIDALIAEGVATIEIKSGYGLDRDTELQILRAARKIATLRPVEIKTSFLGAHAIPPEFANRPDDYIDKICIPTLITAHQESLIDAVDGFCEGIAFTPKQIERVFQKAKELGLPVKLHAEQLSNLGGTQIAAKYTALSADHLEYTNGDDVKALAKSGSVAVLLPGAFYTLRETQYPPIELFRQHNVSMALATDCNPGSSPLASLLLTMNMACTVFRLTPLEALQGVTKNAAKALGIKTHGILQAGAIANLAIWNIRHPKELAYRIGFNPLHKRVFKGKMQ